MEKNSSLIEMELLLEGSLNKIEHMKKCVDNQATTVSTFSQIYSAGFLASCYRLLQTTVLRAFGAGEDAK